MFQFYEICGDCGHVQWRSLLFWRIWLRSWCVEVRWIGWGWRRWSGDYLAFYNGYTRLAYGTYGPLMIEHWSQPQFYVLKQIAAFGCEKEAAERAAANQVGAQTSQES